MEFENGKARIQERHKSHRVSGKVHLIAPPVGQRLVCRPIPMDRWAPVGDDEQVTCGVCLSRGRS